MLMNMNDVVISNAKLNPNPDTVRNYRRNFRTFLVSSKDYTVNTAAKICH